VQCRRLSLFRLQIDARCAALLQLVHAREQQRASESMPLVGWACSNHPDFPDGIFPTAIGHLVAFTETQCRKRACGIDRDQIEVGLVAGDW
jgi:hypothetical protein